jgi:transcription elongation factor GreA
VRAFLTYAKEEGLVQISLAPHLRVRRGLSKAKRTLKQSSRERVELTPQAEAQLKSELSALKEKRPYIAEELRKAAADKDFRENAPLDAARESKEQLEARIKELESTLNSAVVAKKGIEDVRKARLSSKIVLQDLASNKELSYTLVSPNEVDPLKGKISLHSPMGKALFNHQEGEVIEVVAPLGKLYYRIERIES